MEQPVVRKGQGSVKLTHEEFVHGLSKRFYYPNLDALREEIDRILETAWNTGLTDPRPKWPGATS